MLGGSGTQDNWLPDREKDGEVFSNSVCLTFCLKHFIEEKRVEVWDRYEGRTRTFSTGEEARDWYEMLKAKPLNRLMVESGLEMDSCH